MHLPLVFVPDSLELLNQVSRRNDFATKATDQFDRPGIDSRDIGVGMKRVAMVAELFDADFSIIANDSRRSFSAVSYSS